MIYMRTELDPFRTGLNITKTPDAWYFHFAFLGRQYHRKWTIRRSKEGKWSYSNMVCKHDVCSA
jgi:hypothetical protein